MAINVKFDSKIQSVITNMTKEVPIGLTKGAIRIHGDAVKNAEGSVVTGRLRASLTYAVDNNAPTGHSTTSESEPGDSSLSAGDMEAVVGTNVEYAEKVERTSRTPGYLRRSFDTNKSQVESDIRDALKKAVKV